MMPAANSAAAPSHMHHSVSAPAGRGNNLLQGLASSAKGKDHARNISNDLNVLGAAADRVAPGTHVQTISSVPPVASAAASRAHELPPVNLTAQNWSLEQLG